MMENLFRPSTTGPEWLGAYLAASNDNWAYVNGAVEFGAHHSDLARLAAVKAGLDDTAATYVSNIVARQQMPEGVHCALGVLSNGRPSIWVSNVDRNLVMSEVTEALKKREFVR